MTIIVNFIEGNRRAACKNDALSVIDTRGGLANVIDFLPLGELGGYNRGDVEQAFARVAQTVSEPAELCCQARQLLGLQGPGL